MSDASQLNALTVPARQSPFADAHGLGHFQVAWDSTSLGLLKECPRKYYYEIVLGWRPKGQSVHLKFGQLYHSGLEAYDHYCASIGKLEGGLTDDEHMEGIRRCLFHVLSKAGEYRAPACTYCHEGWIDLTGKPAMDFAARAYKCEACGGTGQIGEKVWEPWRSQDPYKNMWTLCRTLVWYLDTFRNSPLRTVTLSNGKPAVELSFYFEAGDVDGISYGFCGHLDRVVMDKTERDRESIHDRKTTKGQLNANFWQGFNPHNQFTLYTVAGTVHYERPTWGITVDAAQVLVNSSAYARQFIAYPPALIDEWLAETKVWITLAARFAQANSWPKNDKSCGNYGGCPFRKVCSKAPAFRQAWLEGDFMHNRWNPLEIRGDI